MRLKKEQGRERGLRWVFEREELEGKGQRREKMEEIVQEELNAIGKKSRRVRFLIDS